MNLKNLILKEGYISVDIFSNKLVYIDGSYQTNTIVNTEYPRTKNIISLIMGYFFQYLHVLCPYCYNVHFSKYTIVYLN